MAESNEVIVRVQNVRIINGEDGYSPTITAERENDGVRLTIVNKDGPHEQKLYDGASAYTQAVAGGYAGTEAQFMTELARIGDLQDQIDDLSYEPVEISTFAVSPASAELGSTVNDVTVTYALNKTPAALTLDNAAITPAQSGTQALTGQGITTNKAFTLAATDDGSPSNPPASASKIASLRFYNSIYWGAAELPETPNSAFLLTLSGHAVSGTKGRTINVNAASRQYIWYALPVRLGACAFKVGGFEGGFSTRETISHTNASGYTESYYVYRSDSTGLGQTAVVVS